MSGIPLLRRLPRPPGDDEAAYRETLSGLPGLAQHVAKLELALDEFEDAGVADRADREMTEIAAPERRGRRGGAGAG